MASLPRILGRYVAPPLILMGLLGVAYWFSHPRYVIVPGQVTGDRSVGINSSFIIQRAKPILIGAGANWPSLAPTGIESDLYGGACILFRARDLGYDEIKDKVCHNDGECHSDKGPGYCDMHTQQCWARPGVPIGEADPLCKRSIDTATSSNEDGKQWQEGEVNFISDQPIKVPQELTPNAQARTYAILKGKAGTTPPVVIRWGAPKPIP
jgi:hypothetical protein